jgi:hypothetical protein
MCYWFISSKIIVVTLQHIVKWYLGGCRLRGWGCGHNYDSSCRCHNTTPAFTEIGAQVILDGVVGAVGEVACDGDPLVAIACLGEDDEGNLLGCGLSWWLRQWRWHDSSLWLGMVVLMRLQLCVMCCSTNLINKASSSTLHDPFIESLMDIDAELIVIDSIATLSCELLEMDGEINVLQ